MTSLKFTGVLYKSGDQEEVILEIGGIPEESVVKRFNFSLHPTLLAFDDRKTAAWVSDYILQTKRTLKERGLI